MSIDRKESSFDPLELKYLYQQRFNYRKRARYSIVTIDRNQFIDRLLKENKRMFLLNLPINLKEQAAIERRRREENERLSRIFNVKYRTIGVG